MDGRIRFVYATCGRRYFCIRIKKFADTKISGYVWTGPQVSGPVSQDGRHQSAKAISYLPSFLFVFTTKRREWVCSSNYEAAENKS